MIKKHVLLLIAIFVVTNFYSQSSSQEPSYLVVDWKEGDKKTVLKIDSTIAHINDSIFMQTEVKSNYKIEIVNKKDSVYEVLFKQLNVDSDALVRSEIFDANPIQKLLQNLIIEIQKEMLGLEYSFLVNEYDALAFEITNENALVEHIEEAVVVMLNQFLDASKVEIEENQRKEIRLRVKDYLDQNMAALMQTMLNEFNYIFQAYSMPFVLNQEYITTVNTYNVDQVNYGDKETPSTLRINNSIQDSNFNITYAYDYNKKEAYQEYIVAAGKGDQIAIKDFDISEKVISDFDIDTSWIKNSRSIIKLKMGFVKVYNTTRIEIK